jgi:hypothetical protein
MAGRAIGVACAVAVMTLAACSHDTSAAKGLSCHSLNTGVSHLRNPDAKAKQPPEEDLRDAKLLVAAYDDDFADALRLVADRYVAIASNGVDRRLPDDDAAALRHATSVLTRECRNAGFPVDFSPFISSATDTSGSRDPVRGAHQ